jgi:hypothetical protein
MIKRPMKKLLIVAFILFSNLHLYGNELASFFTEADGFLKTYVKNGNVAYDKINKNPGDIEKLYKTIGSMDLSGATHADKKAFYINAYNLVVIYWVVKNYPLKSPMDNSGFFDKVKHTVAGESLTLNALEKNKLLIPYKDARFHFVLVCAAKSCPPLPGFAFLPDQLDQQLTDRTRLAINSKWLMVDASRKKVAVSKIFDWYKNDFTQGGKTTLEWINQYRKEKIPTSYQVEFYEYDWTLNQL